MPYVVTIRLEEHVVKKLGLYIVIVSWGWLVLYLAGAFTAASFDVTTWDALGRYLISALAIGVAGFSAFVFVDAV